VKAPSPYHKKGGFSYTLTDQQIREYLKLSPQTRLEWLEEANRFLYNASDEKTREIRRRFRTGEIQS